MALINNGLNYLNKVHSAYSSLNESINENRASNRLDIAKEHLEAEIESIVQDVQAGALEANKGTLEAALRGHTKQMEAYIHHPAKFKVWLIERDKAIADLIKTMG